MDRKVIAIKKAKKLIIKTGAKVFNWQTNKIERLTLDADLHYTRSDVLAINGSSIHFKEKNNKRITAHSSDVIVKNT